MEFLGLGLIIVGLIVILIGWIIFLIAAFRESVLWGVLCLFSGGIAPLIFLFMHWGEAKKGFGIQVIGYLMIFGVLLRRVGDHQCIL